MHYLDFHSTNCHLNLRDPAFVKKRILNKLQGFLLINLKVLSSTFLTLQCQKITCIHLHFNQKILPANRLPFNIFLNFHIYSWKCEISPKIRVVWGFFCRTEISFSMVNLKKFYLQWPQHFNLRQRLIRSVENKTSTKYIEKQLILTAEDSGGFLMLWICFSSKCSLNISILQYL